MMNKIWGFLFAAMWFTCLSDAAIDIGITGYWYMAVLAFGLSFCLVFRKSFVAAGEAFMRD